MEDTAIVTSVGLSNALTSPEADSSVLEIVGGNALSGHVSISGAKNSALVVMAGTLLCPNPAVCAIFPSWLTSKRMGGGLVISGG